ncbi:MAG: homoserine dehydrogenase [Candidatus Cloacimonetes bacterium]|nr:homoserine dehydrogenase [Candidatus Cloacimonadota bacterium]
MKQKIALLGFGTVGQGICEILLNKKEYLKEKYNYEFEFVAVADFAFGSVYNPNGLNIPAMLEEAKAKKKFTRDLTTLDNVSLITKCNADVVCELTYTDLDTGGPAIEHCKAALESKKHIVTSNKGPAALRYPEMKALADKKGVKFMIEGTVVAGTPIINLVEGPLAGCEISKIRGILNGTTNYMLSEMEKGMGYDEVLKVAQDLGYAEANPAGDVEGYDARGKVTILANIVMGASMKINEVPCRGITKITSEDIQKAKDTNARWKLIGTVENKDGEITGSVSPEMIDLSHPLAGVMGATNALTFTTDLLGDVTIVGPGAGRIETGFSILTDLLQIHNSSCNCK